MKIGRRIFYEKSTGKILFDAGDREGDVIPTTPEQDYIGYNPDTMGYIELAFGEYREEIQNMGSWKVDTNAKTLIIYPRIQVTVDKQKISSDGIDKAIITAIAQDDCIVTFHINDLGEEIRNTVNKIVTFEFQSELPGMYIINVSTELYGQNSAQIEVI